MTSTAASRDTWQGILIEDPRVSVTVGLASEYGTRVGPAIPDDANTGNLDLRTLLVTRDDAVSVNSVELVVSRSGSAATAGVPVEITATVGTGAAMGWQDPTGVSGFARLGSTTFGEIRISRRAGERASYVESTDLSGWTSGAKHDICPGTDDGEILHVRVTASPTVLFIRSEVYADGSLTDPEINEQPTSTPTATYTVQRVRVATYRGTALLLVEVQTSSGDPRTHIEQYGSDDGGRSWRYIGRTSTDPYGLGDIETSPAGYLIAHAVNAGSSAGDIVRVSSIASPFAAFWATSYASVDINAAVWDDTPDHTVSDLEVALCSDEAGTVWMYVAYLALMVVTARASVDDGKTWAEPVSDRLEHVAIAYGGTFGSADRPTALDAVCVAGASWLAFSYGSSGYVARLGGWSERGVTVPSSSRHSRGPSSYTHGWRSVYMGTTDLPTEYAFTASGTAAATAANDHVSWTGSTGTRDARLYSVGSLQTDDTSTSIVRWTSRADAARTSEEAPVVVDILASSTTEVFGLRVAIGSDEVAVYQRTGAGWAIKGSAVTHSYGDVWAEWIAWLEIDHSDGGYILRVCGRTTGSATLAVPASEVLDDWSDHVSTTGTLVDCTAVDAAAVIRFGGYVASGEIGRVAWLGLDVCDGADERPPGRPDEILGRPLRGVTWCPPDILVQPGDGIGHAGDTWAIATDADGAIGNVLTGDITQGWEAPGTDEVVITVSWGASQPGPVMGLLIAGITAEEMTAESVPGAFDHDLARAVGTIEGEAYGDSIRPLTSIPVMWREGETNAALLIDDGADVVARHMAQARAGWWGDVAPTRWVVDGGTLGLAAGTDVDVTVMPDGLLLVWQPSAGDNETGVTLTLSAATATWPAGTRWAIKRILAGPVIVFGDRYGYGWSVRTEAPTDEGRTSDGRLHPRAIRPPYRVVSIDWSDGVDVLQAPEGGDDTTGGITVAVSAVNPAVAWAGSTAYTIPAILRQISGSQGEVVLIRDVPTTGGEAVAEEGSTTIYPRDYLHGRVTTSVQVDQALGTMDEEVLRVNTITIEEIT